LRDEMLIIKLPRILWLVTTIFNYICDYETKFDYYKKLIINDIFNPIIRVYI